MRAEEYVVEELLKLKKENDDLRLRIFENKAINDEIIEENLKLKKEIENMKEDFKIQILYDVERTPYIRLERNTIWAFLNKEKYEHYKNLFNLKEETEEEGEKKDEIQ